MPRTAPVCARCKMPLAFVAAAVLTAGVSGRKQWGNLFMDFAFMGGALSHDQDRFVNDNLAELGKSSASASFDSRFISSEAGVSVNFPVGPGLTVTPGARVRYSAQWLDGYTETGSSNANATVAERSIGVLESNAELAVTKQFGFGSIVGRLGILGRTSTGDKDVSLSLIGVNNFVGFGTGDDVAGYVGLGASFVPAENLILELDGQAVFGGDVTGVQGLARVTKRF